MCCLYSRQEQVVFLIHLHFGPVVGSQLGSIRGPGSHRSCSSIKPLNGCLSNFQMFKSSRQKDSENIFSCWSGGQPLRRNPACGPSGMTHKRGDSRGILPQVLLSSFVARVARSDCQCSTTLETWPDSWHFTQGRNAQYSPNLPFAESKSFCES